MREFGRTGIGLVAVGLVAAAVLTVTGVAVAGVLQDESTDDAGLIDRLVALEEQLPILPPDTVDVDPEQTWATFTGDFTGARVALDAVADEARALFVDAEQADGPVATAVAEVARSVLVLRSGYEYLADWETNDLTFPLDTADDDAVATGADELYGAAQTGFSLVLDARARALGAYAVLRDAQAADPEDRQVLERRYEESLAFDTGMKPDIHEALSFETTQVMRTVSRFVSTAPGDTARARMMTVVCIDREAYTTAELVDAGSAAALVTTPADDCPDLENGNEVVLVQR